MSYVPVGVDDDNQLPSEVREALAGSPELSAAIGEAVAGVADPIVTLSAWVPGEPARPLSPDLSQVNVYGSSSERRIQDALVFLLPLSWGMTVNKLALGGETIEDSLARTGVAPVRIQFPNNTIPATGTVNLAATSFSPLSSGLAPYRVAVTSDSGTRVEGTIARVSAGVYSFTRAVTGDALGATGSVVAYPTLTNGGTRAAPALRDKVAILSGAKNNLSEADVVTKQAAAMTALYDSLVAVRPVVVLLGLFNNRGSDAVSKAKIAAINTWRQHFAATHENVAYVSMQDYITSADLWTYTGISPTTDDLAKQAAGELPVSISDDSQHMNNAGTNGFIRHRLLPALATLLGRTYVMPGTWYAQTSDSFNRANATTMAGQSTDAAAGGSVMAYESFRSTAWGIASDHLAVGSAPQNSFLAIATSGNDQRISVKYTTLPVGGETFLNLRRSALDPAGANGYRLRVHTTGSLLVQRVDGGVATSLHTTISGAVVAGAVVTLEVVGSTVRALVNGTEVFSTSDTTYPAGGFAGISGVTAMSSVALDDLFYEQRA